MQILKLFTNLLLLLAAMTNLLFDTILAIVFAGISIFLMTENGGREMGITLLCLTALGYGWRLYWNFGMGSRSRERDSRLP